MAPRSKGGNKSGGTRSLCPFSSHACVTPRLGGRTLGFLTHPLGSASLVNLATLQASSTQLPRSPLHVVPAYPWSRTPRRALDRAIATDTVIGTSFIASDRLHLAGCLLHHMSTLCDRMAAVHPTISCTPAKLRMLHAAPDGAHAVLPATLGRTEDSERDLHPRVRVISQDVPALFLVRRGSRVCSDVVRAVCELPATVEMLSIVSQHVRPGFSASRHRLTDFDAIPLRAPSYGRRGTRKGACGSGTATTRHATIIGYSYIFPPCTLDAVRTRRGVLIRLECTPGFELAIAPALSTLDRLVYDASCAFSFSSHTSCVYSPMAPSRIDADSAGTREFAHERWPWYARRAWGWDGMTKKRDGWMEDPHARLSVVGANRRYMCGWGDALVAPARLVSECCPPRRAARALRYSISILAILARTIRIPEREWRMGEWDGRVRLASETGE
ncbi:hypothetical protein C8R45DRAFT_1224369 [Mycena sanguinolenta]|nr:hypothetical protein C8R45DRAFT_1224369 [Mycena sanguinolenta]